MSLFFALLISLALHLSLIAAPYWFSGTEPDAPKTARLNATLIPATPTAAPPQKLPDEVSTRGSDSVPQKSLLTKQASSRQTNPSTLRHAQGLLSKHLFYPPTAVAQGLEGEVILLLKLDDKGRIGSIEIARSSGHALLDQAAVDAARQMGGLPGSPRETLLPVNFRLQ